MVSACRSSPRSPASSGGRTFRTSNPSPRLWSPMPTAARSRCGHRPGSRSRGRRTSSTCSTSASLEASTEDTALGDIVLETLRAFAADGGSVEMLNTYAIAGDPAVSVALAVRQDGDRAGACRDAPLLSALPSRLSSNGRPSLSAAPAFSTRRGPGVDLRALPPAPLLEGLPADQGWHGACSSCPARAFGSDRGWRGVTPPWRLAAL